MEMWNDWMINAITPDIARDISQNSLLVNGEMEKAMDEIKKAAHTGKFHCQISIPKVDDAHERADTVVSYLRDYGYDAHCPGVVGGKYIVSISWL